jgi:catechol 2,3-dioxygenase
MPIMTYGIAPPRYRLPAATHLGAVTLQVGSLDRSLAYYQDVLGLSVVHRRGDHATLAPSGQAHGLVYLRERAGARPVPRHGRLGLYHFAILLPDRASLGRFVAHLADRGLRPGASDHAVSEALYLWDPDGLGIEVYADRPREAWQLRGRELHMTVDPLDLQALARVGGGTKWQGMPTGTILGHMHLHVGDLATAEAFYHAALGFDKIAWSYPGALFLSAGGYHHHLGTNTWAAGAPPAGPDDARLLEWEIVLPSADDRDQASASITSAGYHVNVDDDVHTLEDPWGTTFRITVEHPRTDNRQRS